MRRSFYILFPFALTILLSFFIYYYPGNVRVKWLGYEIDSNIWAAIFIIGLALLLLNFLIRILLWILGTPFRVKKSWTNSHAKKDSDNLILLINSIESENIPEATGLQKKLANSLKGSPLFPWFLARSFEMTEQYSQMDKLIAVLKNNPHSLFLGFKLQIRNALKQKKHSLALELLEQARIMQPKSSWVLKHLYALSREFKKYEEAIKLIICLKDLGYFTAEHEKTQRANIYYHYAVTFTKDSSKQEEYLLQSYSLNPGYAECSYALAELLKNKGKSRRALNIIETTWALDPQQKLGDLYLDILAPKASVETYNYAKKLTNNNTQQPESLLFLARSAFKASLWGEARENLIKLIKVHPTSIAYKLMADIEISEYNNLKAAKDWLDKGIEAQRYSPSF